MENNRLSRDASNAKDTIDELISEIEDVRRRKKLIKKPCI